jgi:hypothetical protein
MLPVGLSENNPFRDREQTDEARALNRPSRAHAGKSFSFARHKQSNKVREKISEQNRHMLSLERCKRVSIKGVLYPSISEASILTTYSRKTIRKRCHSISAKDADCFFVTD